MRKPKENGASKPNPAWGALARKIASIVGKEEKRITEIPGVSLHQRTAPTPPCRATYHPGILVVAQGRKQVNLGPTSFTYTNPTAGLANSGGGSTGVPARSGAPWPLGMVSSVTFIPPPPEDSGAALG